MSSPVRWLVCAALCLLLSNSMAFAGASAPDAVIFFAPGTDIAAVTDNQSLDQIVAKAKADPGNWVYLEAFANDLGSRELNLALAQRRIEDVSRRLALLGFPSHRIRGASYREKLFNEDDLPVRRVEIRIEKLGF